jgi:hypothetical protein
LLLVRKGAAAQINAQEKHLRKRFSETSVFDLQIGFPPTPVPFVVERVGYKPIFLSEEISMPQVILKQFETPDEVISFEKGRFEKISLGGMTIGRAVYEPGWKWSTHIGLKSGAKLCQVEHVGLVVSGRATAAMEDGTIIEMRPGDLFYIPPGHDSWVVGNEPYVSLHFLGAEKYAH